MDRTVTEGVVGNPPPGGGQSRELFHVAYPHVLPKRKPACHKPGASRYALRWRKPVGIPVSQYHAIDRVDLGPEQRRAFFELLIGSFAEHYGPSSPKTMTFVDEQAVTNPSVAFHRLDGTARTRRSVHAMASRWFAEPDRLTGFETCWRAIIVVPYDRHETIYSGTHYLIGLAVAADAAIMPMTPNGYFGVERDRLPIAAIESLDIPLASDPPQARTGDIRDCRLFAATPHNMTGLRSGPFWRAAEPMQPVNYIDGMEPKLSRGMGYLTSNTGVNDTLSLLVMINLDDDDEDKSETSVLAYFLSFEKFRNRANSQDSRFEIYRHVIAMNRKFKANRELPTCHGSHVLSIRKIFEYVNCRLNAGLLPFVATLRVA